MLDNVIPRVHFDGAIYLITAASIADSKPVASIKDSKYAGFIKVSKSEASIKDSNSAGYIIYTK